MEQLVIANWKMNGNWNKINADLVYYMSQGTTNKPNMVLALPYPYLGSARGMLDKALFKLAAQDLSRYHDYGAFTGEISGGMLKDVGAGYVLIGHSERRHLFGESSAALIDKVKNAVASNLIPVFCVGEPREFRNDGSYLKYIEQQLHDLSKCGEVKELVIAYEPCWAIGSGKTPSSANIKEVVDFIHGYMQKVPGCAKIHVLYGGSVTSQNVREILLVPNVNGVLVGGASLIPADFTAICSHI